MALMAIFNDQSFRVGDRISVWQKIVEGDKTRTQAFEGMVIAIRGMGPNKMFTVRKIGAAKVGIERIFPLSSPNIEKIVVAQKGWAKRAKLYYLRGRPASDYSEVGKKYKRKNKK